MPSEGGGGTPPPPSYPRHRTRSVCACPSSRRAPGGAARRGAVLVARRSHEPLLLCRERQPAIRAGGGLLVLGHVARVEYAPAGGAEPVRDAHAPLEMGGHNRGGRDPNERLIRRATAATIRRAERGLHGRARRQPCRRIATRPSAAVFGRGGSLGGRRARLLLCRDGGGAGGAAGRARGRGRVWPTVGIEALRAVREGDHLYKARAQRKGEGPGQEYMAWANIKPYVGRRTPATARV